MGSKHYPLSPSAMERILACPGSVKLCEGIESKETSYSREGTVAHEYAAEVLRGNWPATPRLCNRCNAALVTPPCQLCGSNEYRDDTEMERYVSVYIDFINHLRSTCEITDEGIEETIVDSDMPDFGGTVDYWCTYWSGADFVIHVVDLKYGAGTPVSVEDNAQLKSYLLLASYKFPLANNCRFRATIVQPRVGEGKPQTAEFDVEDIECHWNVIGFAKGSELLADGPHCKWCPAASTCPQLHQIATEATNGHGDNLEWLLAHRDQLQRLLDELPTRVIAEMQQGREFDGWKAVRSIGNRKWIADEDTILKRLRSRKLGKRQVMEQRLLSPAQMDKAGFGDLIQDLVTRSDLGYRVVRKSAPGEAVTFAPAGDEFDAISEVA